MSLPATPPNEAFHGLDSLNQKAREALDQLRSELLWQRNEKGHWEGELASSSLSTATAVSALSALILNHGDILDTGTIRPLVRRGMAYLSGQQNSDGGFGDTDRSHSNIATTYLVLAASELANQAIGESLSGSSLDQLSGYIDSAGGINALRERYGTDKTFVIPILTNLAIAGLVPWADVSALPFEAAAVPQSMYRLMRMPVVSYAIPALVAIGQARHFHGPRAFLPLRLIRSLAISPTLNVLQRMQPESGGYLEATPLTSFVLMSLAATSRGTNEVGRNALKFLRASIREDGSWPIDTNLATWVTSLSIHALACDPQDDQSWYSESLLEWHLSCQHQSRHAFTGAEPGGWGWTDLTGAVPDGDDTPGAILALQQIRPLVGSQQQKRIDAAIDHGRTWLQKLQNRDGGWPTFCRGWGKLPFDRSSNDLTAHALRALGTDDRDSSRAQRFLAQRQNDDGSWFALWFGNQDHPDEENPVYGTSKVLMYRGLTHQQRSSATGYLIAHQNNDGGWGGGKSLSEKLPQADLTIPEGLTSSVEETALAVDALCTNLLISRDLDSSVEVLKGTVNQPDLAAIIRGVEFLVQSVHDGRHREPWPIGFYFAKLWYHERLYPLVFAIAALGKFLRIAHPKHDNQWPS